MSIVPQKLVEIRKLHAAYVRLTGLAVALDLQGYREMLWSQWLREGFTEGDLAAVVRYVKGCIRKGDRGFNVGSLRFNSLIGQTDRFGELLAEAAATRRNAEGRSPKSEILRATGRDSQGPIANSQRAGDVAAGLAGDPAKAQAAFEELKKLKESL